VIFEKLLTQGSEGVGVQSLLIPLPLQLAPHEASLLELHLDQLNAAGIHIHEIGPHSFLVDGIPTVFGNVDMTKLIKDLLENLKDFAANTVVEKEIERRIALSASYASVNHAKRLSVEEAQTLINRLFSCQTPFLCPLGKPTISVISSEELVKKFQKVGL
jgi:DNA mismatch repair protein MutL